MKKIIRSIILFWGIVALFILGYYLYAFFPFRAIEDGQALATTWLDSNANGRQDAGEKPLAGVCVWDGYYLEVGSELDSFCASMGTDDSQRTNKQGQWSRFLPGGNCSGVFIFAQTPAGLQATTNLASDGCNAKFGFVAKDVPVKQNITSIDAFIQQRNLLTWSTNIGIGLIVIAFGVLGTIWLQKD